LEYINKNQSITHYKYKLKSTILIFLILHSYISQAQTRETDPAYLKNNFGIWQKDESKHFILYYRNYPPAKKNISHSKLLEVLEGQEESLLEISQKTGIDSSTFKNLVKINIWLFSNLKEQRDITKINSPAFSIFPYRSMYFPYNLSHNKHELSHLISQEYWGLFHSSKFQMLIEEGFVNYIDEWGIKKGNFTKSAKKVIRNKKDYIQMIIDNKSSGAKLFVNPYKRDIIVSSAFVKFLIDNYGIEKFKTLWTLLKTKDNTFDEVYSKSFQKLKTDFYDWLKK